MPALSVLPSHSWPLLKYEEVDLSVPTHISYDLIIEVKTTPFSSVCRLSLQGGTCINLAISAGKSVLPFTAISAASLNPHPCSKLWSAFSM